jgi:hypothetical protein
MKNSYLELLNAYFFSSNSARSFCLISSANGANLSSNSSIFSLDKEFTGRFLSSNGIRWVFFFGIFNIKQITKENPNIVKNNSLSIFIFYFKLCYMLLCHLSCMYLTRFQLILNFRIVEINLPTFAGSYNSVIVSFGNNIKFHYIMINSCMHIFKRKSRIVWVIMNYNCILKFKKIIAKGKNTYNAENKEFGLSNDLPSNIQHNKDGNDIFHEKYCLH